MPFIVVEITTMTVYSKRHFPAKEKTDLFGQASPNIYHVLELSELSTLYSKKGYVILCSLISRNSLHQKLVSPLALASGLPPQEGGVLAHFPNSGW